MTRAPSWLVPLGAVALMVGVCGQAAGSDRGTWRFKVPERPVKAVVIGGSVSAWQRGNFGHFLQASCDRLEVVNRGKSKLGARKLRQRFVNQVLKNRRMSAQEREETWLLFLGGLNSVSMPNRTNRAVAEIFRRARAAGIKSMGLTVGPWGADYDKRWKGAEGLRYWRFTRAAVDYIMGRLTRGVAFGADVEEPGAPVASEDLPDVAVNLYDSPLRQGEDAELRSEERTRRQVRKHRRWRRELKSLEGEARETRLEEMVQQVREIPQWYLRKELRAFDHIHPNIEGHRAIARLACSKAPESWGCDCARLDHLQWNRKARGLIVVEPEAPESPEAQAPTPEHGAEPVETPPTNWVEP